MFGSKFGFQSGRVDLISTKWASKAKVSVLGKSRFFEISEIQSVDSIWQKGQNVVRLKMLLTSSF